jgi:ribulose-5-phosphate 4-epimerase/fuculose-1-phosphate aldolase
MELFERGKPSEYNELTKLISACFEVRKDITSAYISKDEYIMRLAETERFIPAVTNDVAQLVARRIPIYNTAQEAIKPLARMLRFSWVIVVKGIGAVCIGRSPTEAMLVKQTAENGAKTYVEAVILGGTRQITRLDAFRMQQAYKRLYK